MDIKCHLKIYQTYEEVKYCMLDAKKTVLLPKVAFLLFFFYKILMRCYIASYFSSFCFLLYH